MPKPLTLDTILDWTRRGTDAIIVDYETFVEVEAILDAASQWPPNTGRRKMRDGSTVLFINDKPFIIQ